MRNSPFVYEFVTATLISDYGARKYINTLTLPAIQRSRANLADVFDRDRELRVNGQLPVQVELSGLRLLSCDSRHLYRERLSRVPRKRGERSWAWFAPTRLRQIPTKNETKDTWD